ncbi:early nodulin-like protein 1 [Rhodamnia argentea]|uniref:Early nodulin-like protein 1 n=1 Tax=Rhodamnia argentea TaxID=178133 RepID=A0A8B8QSG7_9MYRT|nr:early nodulin-like protein 1 [Rhodamnia argentea]
MESTRFVAWLFVAVALQFAACSEAYDFYVGGKDGWVQNPSEGYNQWAGRNRFQVNDTLFFKYEKGKDSVLVVTKDDYNSCDTNKPLVSLTDGGSRFKFDRSGPFFFISGIADRCNAGQKLIVVVLAIRPKAHGSPSTPSPVPPVAQPPASPPPGSDTPAGVPPQPAGPSPSDAEAPAPAPSRSSSSKVGFPWAGGVGLVIALGVSLLIGG